MMTLGYISAFSETLALAVIIAHGVEALGEALEKECEVHIKVNIDFTLGRSWVGIRSNRSSLHRTRQISNKLSNPSKASQSFIIPSRGSSRI
jgi:hypothetical protein